MNNITFKFEKDDRIRPSFKDVDNMETDKTKCNEK